MTGGAAAPGLKVFSSVLIGLGVALWAVYLLYLPMPQWFQSEAALQQGGVVDPGMILYSLATAGAALVVWGRVLASADEAGVGRAQLLSASALGMLLLGLMRVGTVLFPHGPFREWWVLPVTEGIAFSLLAWLLFRMARS